MKAYLTPAKFGEAEYTDKKSRFIGRVWPVRSEEEAAAKIAEVRARHRDASHNVYAYTLREGGITRFSDDGEPGGTSGQPTLNVLRSGGVEDALCVVTRYFGGILLGSGGLVRAYSNTARLALEAAGLAEMASWRELTLRVTYSFYDRLRLLLTELSAAVESADFAADVTVRALVREELARELERRVTELTGGSALVRYGECSFRAV